MVVDSFNLAWFSLTYQCNSRCKWCYAASNYYESSKNKNFDINRLPGLVSLFNELNLPRVTLIGGEPTVYPYLERVVGGLSKSGIKVGMVTNGRRLSDRECVRRLKKEGLLYATFSIEGSCPEIHDGTSQVNGSLYQALQGIENCHLEGLDVTSNTLISNLNVNDLERIVDLLLDVKVSKMSYNICGVCITKDGNNDYMLDPRHAVSAFERVYSYAKSKGVRARLVTPMPWCNFSEERIGELKEDKVLPGGPCHIVHGRNFVIDYNGDIVPCTHLTGYPLMNIFVNEEVISGEEFVKLYNSQNAQKFRQMMARYPSQKCVGCTENCVGGCPLYWTKFDPDEQIRGFAQISEKI